MNSICDICCINMHVIINDKTFFTSICEQIPTPLLKKAKIFNMGENLSENEITTVVIHKCIFPVSPKH